MWAKNILKIKDRYKYVTCVEQTRKSLHELHYVISNHLETILNGVEVKQTINFFFLLLQFV